MALLIFVYALTTLRVLEARLHSFLSLRFDNIVFLQSAGHHLRRCYLRPIAADVVDALGIHF